MDIHRCRFVDYTPHTITATAFSHNSDASKPTPKPLRIAIGRADGSIEIWNPRNTITKWLLESTIMGSQGRSVEGLVWSSELDTDSPPRLFSIGGSTFITEWDSNKGIPIKNQDSNAGVIWSVAINKLQDKIALGCDDGSVVVVNIQGGPGIIEHETILQRQKSRVLSLCWLNDNMVIGGCADGRIRCWSYSGDDKGRLIQTLRVDKSKTESTLIWSLLALDNSNQLVSGDSTGSIKFWDLKHFVLQQSFTPHDADILCMTRDETGTKIFTSGVDRKIFNFNLIKTGKNSHKWVNSSNRLLHSNDVRAMDTYQSKNMDVLVSGGVERILSINSIENFQTSVPIKLPINSFNQNVIINEDKRLLLMWQNQEIKIWKLNEDQTKRLVCKLTLSDPDSITSVAISKNGRYLVVARLTTIKLFELVEIEYGNKLEVCKVSSGLLESLGARLIKFADDEGLLVLVNLDNEVTSLKFNVNDDELEDDDLSYFDDDQEPLEYETTQSTRHNYTHLEINNSSSLAALSSFTGTIELINLKSGEVRKLIKLNDVPTAIKFTGSDTLLVTTLDHKLLELNTDESSSDLLTTWGKSISESLPQQFITLTGQPYGIFENLGRFWIWGVNWISFFDTTVDPTSNNKPVPQTQGRKRTRNGASTSVTPATTDDSNSTSSHKNFWFTSNYKSMLLVDKLSDTELVIVERPVEEMPSTPAFKINKINV